jgi:Phosphotransferase enzyme family
VANDNIESAIAVLLASIGRSNSNLQLEPLSASGNNRVFTVHANGDTVVAKWYFHDQNDTRDRLGAEYAFLEHAWHVGLRCIPQPLGKDQANHLALYELIEGDKIEARQVDEATIQQAASFLAQLNSAPSRNLASALPLASEACFSMVEHFSMVDTRLARLAGMPLEQEVDFIAAKFVAQLLQFWRRTKTHLLYACTALKLNPDIAVPQSERFLSPSDFGFHNALVRPDGRLCFIDFEYAGWDDPAKTVGDFFSHPGVTVPHTQFESFLAQALSPFEAAESMAERVRLLEPISQVKWCCIILNEFLPAAARRRNFANPNSDVVQHKQRQLDKAKQLFESLKH